MLWLVIVAFALQYRTIDLSTDADLAAANHLDACVATFGGASEYEGRQRYLAWLARKIEEFPDGFVLALQDGMCIGQLELEAPYGLGVGYINLFCTTPPFRRQGFGRLLHHYADRYFRSWEVDRVELHVSPTNQPAVSFYREMGYRFIAASDRPDVRLWKMAKRLAD